MMTRQPQARMKRSIHIIMIMIVMVSTILPVVAAQGNNDDEERCTLNCPLDAPCTWSDVPVTEEEDDSQKRLLLRGQTPEQQQRQLQRRQHCACPPGWTGLLCETKYESCSNRGGTNNDDRCYHGGRCVEEAVDAFGNPQLMCDCSTAQSTTVINNGGNDGSSTRPTTNIIRYVGKYCEHPMEEQCDAENPDRFCVNGGDCNPNVENDGIACLCPTGYHGLHCEFDEAQVPVKEFCTLDCLNGGSCLLGTVDQDEYMELQRIWGDSDIDLTNFQHMKCVCPSGFGGPLCQAKEESCTDLFDDEDEEGSLSCFHGGRCVRMTSSLGHSEYNCDCTTSSDSQGNRYTGDYCQIQSTVLCDNEDPSFFCTHAGTCPNAVYEPCQCPDGYEGFRCEYSTTSSSSESSPMASPTIPIHHESDPAAAAAVPCGNIMCLHGSQCLTRDETDTDEPEEYCDCSTADRPDLFLAFAGNGCQYQSTTICPTPAPQNDSPTSRTTTPPSPTRMSFCVHQGQCLETPNEDGSQCSCQKGWTGPHCEFEASVPTDDVSLPQCGDTVCYHGGKCVETSVTLQEGGDDDASAPTTTIEYYCDCSQAYDEHFMYSGKSCEYPSTSICDDPLNTDNIIENPSVFFCANHGTCILEDLDQGCICRTGFSGAHCEYLNIDPAAAGNDDDEDGNADSDTSTEEPEVNQCDDSTYCRNGGTCVVTSVNHDGDVRRISHCDCSTTATASTIFAGPHCEYAATTYCTDPFDGEGSNAENVVILASAVFCVQGGTCRENVFEGCDCPAGWTGFRCEFPIDIQNSVEDGDSNNADDDDPAPVECGGMACYHGGTCLSSNEEDPTTGVVQESLSCDCSTATTTASDGTIEVYGGLTCSTKNTSVCQQGTGGDSSEPLVCMNHGTCREDPTEGCECQPGFTGMLCDMEFQDDTHREHGVECGDSFCYHGGTCLSVKIIQPDGQPTTRATCDCTLAVDEDHLYAGSSCQYKSTTLCTNPTPGLSLEGTLFCVNGGTCKESSDGSPNFQQGCDCPAGWTGFFCEFPEDSPKVDETPVDLESCGEHSCYNGGKCIKSRITGVDGTSYNYSYCDCTLAYNENNLFAGRNCQFPSSTLCSDPDPETNSLLGIPFCVNGGTCHPDHVLGECTCPSHWTGLRCEIPVEEATVDNSNVCSDDDDGVFVCQHGGRCDGTGCNCEMAIEGGIRYDGINCEFPATAYCSDPNADSVSLSQVDFCVNGGKCRDGAPCTCPTGYYGPRCEMSLYHDTPATAPTPTPQDTVRPPTNECRLSCANGGSCVKGAKDSSHGVYEQTIGQVAHLNMTFDEVFFEHCVCPPGYVGLTCEHLIETCDRGRNGEDHFCLHGSTCLYDSNGEPYCDCDDAKARIDGKLETTFGGKSCEHPASDICMVNSSPENDDENNRNRKSSPIQPLYFCVNKGVCRGFVTASDPDPGCDCTDDWTGPHCEIHFTQLLVIDDDNFYSTTKDGPKKGLVVGLTLLLLLSLFILIRYARRLSRTTSTSHVDGLEGMAGTNIARKDDDEDGVVVTAEGTDWSSVLRNRLFLRRTQTTPPESYDSSMDPSVPALNCGSASLSLSSPDDMRYNGNDMSMNIEATRRSTLYSGSTSPIPSLDSRAQDPMEPADYSSSHSSSSSADGTGKRPRTFLSGPKRRPSGDDDDIGMINRNNRTSTTNGFNDAAPTMKVYDGGDDDDGIDVAIELL